jgi:metal-responsive CopG/Arc/MetJ family transcriptional regulator
MPQLAENIHVRLQDELLRAIDVFRRSEIDLPTRPEAVRRLLQQAMARQGRDDRLLQAER